MGKRNQALIDVYEDTLASAPGIMGDMPTYSTAKSTLDNKKLSPPSKSLIEVVNMDSVSAAIETRQEYHYARICLLNMASRKRPGGGVKNGARAQEEDLFRCTNLGVVISPSLYPLKENEYLYSDGVYVFKDKDYEPVWPVEVNVISMPAISLNRGKFNKEKNEYEEKIVEPPEDYEEVMLSKIRAMCNEAIDKEQDILILGAWGCGVFKNNPEVVAKFFKQVLVNEGYAKHFKKVIFPVINDHNSVANNYEIFQTILQS